MTQTEQKKRAKQFAARWQGRGYEKGETQKFWIDLLTSVLGVENCMDFIFFEEQVKEKIENKTITNFIDAYIPSTRVMIEQKGSHKDLREPIKQSDGVSLTPFQQAKKYVAELPLSQHPKWIVTCNFSEFLVYDMENPNGEPERILLADLERDFYRLEFLVNRKSENIRREEQVSLDAGKLVGKLYDALFKEYIAPDADSLRSLNILCVRIVFCLYAEDAGLFASKTAFEDYIQSFRPENLRKALIDLFKGLDTKLDARDKYDTALAPFPYVNGGLFAAEDIEIPNFTPEIVDVIVEHCAPFNWSEISPTIFGAVFESTLNPETRRTGGMHYTSIENIHKVIDPLFMNSLTAEFEEMMHIAQAKTREQKLFDFQKKLGSLQFLDPACGSGNFLTETYLSLRRLENRCIAARFSGQALMGDFENPICVKIDNFYGIEINDFAVTVAKTALWIAESQMIAETERLISQTIDFLPLKTSANIVEGNALRMNWATLTAQTGTDYALPETLFFGEIDRTGEHRYDFIMGNPPFVGYSYQSKAQKDDLRSISADIANNIDYVAGWYFKAAAMMKETDIKAAFVSTNSITQGEQVAALWKPLFAQYEIRIDFAWRTFRWNSESTEKAHVHCVIVGFSHKDSAYEQKFIFDSDGKKTPAQNINGYLLDAPDIFIEKRAEPLCDVPSMLRGSAPVDDGNLLMTIDEKAEYVKKEPQGEKFLRPFMMGKDFIDRKPRWCFWLVDASPADLKKCPRLMKRMANIRDFRLKSTKHATQQLADSPTLFGEIRPCTSKYIAIPIVSSERRWYIPIDYLTPDIIAGNKLFQMPNASFYHFGVLTSSVHMAWMRAVCGRLKSDYSYSNTIVYNNFPWCTPTDEQKAAIEQTAQGILDARSRFPDSSLADLYDEAAMPPALRKAHRANDKAVLAAYNFPADITESACVAELFERYRAMTAGEGT
ncbi:MAG: DNA methyltransferase [Treponema sp.]